MRSMVRMRMIMRTVVMAAVVAPCTGGPPGRLPMELPPPEIRSNVVKEVVMPSCSYTSTSLSTPGCHCRYMKVVDL